MSREYDVIVVGARCAGSPTAMLLARRGYRVLLLDRARFPSDTLSTHVVQPHGTAALQRWGLLEALMATGCPPIHTYAYDFGPFTISGSPALPGQPTACCPRRTVLDALLAGAAAQAGAELREGVTVDDLMFEDGRVAGIVGHAGGTPVRARARIVIGADGWHSRIADRVGAERYHERAPLTAAYYAYWSGVPIDGRFELYLRGPRGFGAAPTHDGWTMIIGGWPFAEFDANRHDVEGNFQRMLDLVPDFAERVHAGRRETRFAGATLPNYFRKPFGPGWALVGDAGYLKDSVTAQGISDAFLDAERCVRALEEAFSGLRSFEDAMADYQRARDERVLAMYELTCQLASFAPPPPEMQELLAALPGNQTAMDGFVRMNAGTIPPSEFMAPDNIGAIMSAAHGVA